MAPEVSARGVVQSAIPPYWMRCLACNETWIPKRTTDSGMNTEAMRHLKDCKA